MEAQLEIGKRQAPSAKRQSPIGNASTTNSWLNKLLLPLERPASWRGALFPAEFFATSVEGIKHSYLTDVLPSVRKAMFIEAVSDGSALRRRAMFIDQEPHRKHAVQQEGQCV